jgi:putative SbcD/Mre11-related phosphoesterase
VRAWRFVLGHPALLLEGEARTLVISDLHVGLEEELRRGGIFLPPQTRRLIDRILSLAGETGARRLVLLGDVKHTVSGVSPYELQELRELLSAVAAAFDDVTIVPGNHDAGLGSMSLGPVKLARPSGIKLRAGGITVGLAHGHARIDEIADADLVVVGHNHFYVRGGPGSSYPVWIRCAGCGLKEMIAMPAFNELLGGAALEEGEPRGPAIRALMERDDRAEVYTLDGYYLGTLRSLRSGLLVDADARGIALGTPG